MRQNSSAAVIIIYKFNQISERASLVILKTTIFEPELRHTASSDKKA